MTTAASLEERPPYPCGPSPDGVDAGYWEGLRDGVVRVQRCASCAEWRWPPGPLCSRCHSFDSAWDAVAPRGRVHTWIRTHRPFMDELDVDVPYVTVLVTLDDAPVRLLGLLVGDEDRLEIGAPVTGDILTVENAAWPLLRWRLT